MIRGESVALTRDPFTVSTLSPQTTNIMKRHSKSNIRNKAQIVEAVDMGLTIVLQRRKKVSKCWICNEGMWGNLVAINRCGET